MISAGKLALVPVTWTSASRLSRYLTGARDPSAWIAISAARVSVSSSRWMSDFVMSFRLSAWRNSSRPWMIPNLVTT